MTQTPRREIQTVAERLPIVVAGAGDVGLAVALALKSALPELAVTVVDPALNGPARCDPRAYSLNEASRLFLTDLGVWPAIAPQAMPVSAMTLTDSRLDDPVRAAFLSFPQGHAQTGEARHGHIVPGAAVMAALMERAHAAGVTFRAGAVTGFRAAPEAAMLALADGQEMRAALVVAADGAGSALRQAAGIGFIGRRYRQRGLTGVVGHARPHERRAVQHFLPGGPFARLPLTDGPQGHRSSIVWSEEEGLAASLLAGPAETVQREVERRFGCELGAIALLTPLAAFPLAVGIARRFVGPRIALAGDAAHVVHPLAGQGLNLGLADAQALARTVVEATRLGLDPADEAHLDAYERARRPAAVAMAAATDGLNRLFSNDRLPLRLLRDLGLGLVERAPALKRAFARHAAGM